MTREYNALRPPLTDGRDERHRNEELQYWVGVPAAARMITFPMRQIPFLQGLTAHQHDLLSALFEPVVLQARAPVFGQGDEARHVYVLVEGSVALRYKPYDGPTITLIRLHAGDIFGWSAVLGNAAYTASAVATNRVRALRAVGAGIRSLCREQPGAGSQILQKLAVAVAPRWPNARAEVQRWLEREILERDAHLPRGLPT